MNPVSILNILLFIKNREFTFKNVQIRNILRWYSLHEIYEDKGFH